MCRILALQSDEEEDVRPWLAAFAEACRRSPEYQGHGWGISWMPAEAIGRDAGPGRTAVGGRGWRRYRSTTPIWEDELPSVTSRSVLIHARSAFRNEGIEVGNNMPFLSDGMAFAFNGELRGVRLSVPGETGAARLLELLRRFRSSATEEPATMPDEPAGPRDEVASPRHGTAAALRRLDEVVVTRTEYVRALNLVVAEEEGLFVHSRYSEDPAYFGMHRLRAPGLDAVCSVPLGSTDPSGLEPIDPRLGPDITWEPIPHGSTLEIPSGRKERACSS